MAQSTCEFDEQLPIIQTAANDSAKPRQKNARQKGKVK